VRGHESSPVPVSLGRSYETLKRKRFSGFGLRVIPEEIGRFQVRPGDRKKGVTVLDRFETHRLDLRGAKQKLHVGHSVNRDGQSPTGIALGFRVKGGGLKFQGSNTSSKEHRKCPGQASTDERARDRHNQCDQPTRDMHTAYGVVVGIHRGCRAILWL